MSAGSNTNIRVFVSFKEDSVFAGEDVEATVTFKNIEHPHPPPAVAAQPKRTRPTAPAYSRQPSTTTQPFSRPTHSRQPSVASTAQPPPRTTPPKHRQAQSLTVLENTAKQRGLIPLDGAAAPPTRKVQHGRSVSIVSLGSDASSPSKARGIPASRDPSRPGFKLARSASVQVTPASRGPGRWSSMTGAHIIATTDT